MIRQQPQVSSSLQFCLGIQHIAISQYIQIVHVKLMSLANYQQAPAFQLTKGLWEPILLIQEIDTGKACAYVTMIRNTKAHGHVIHVSF